MVKFKVEWSEQAQKDLKELPSIVVKKLTKRVNEYLALDPYRHGKPLKHEHKGKHSFRFSEYRVIYRIFPHEVIIEVLEAGHRREIY